MTFRSERSTRSESIGCTTADLPPRTSSDHEQPACLFVGARDFSGKRPRFLRTPRHHLTGYTGCADRKPAVTAESRPGCFRALPGLSHGRRSRITIPAQTSRRRSAHMNRSRQGVPAHRLIGILQSDRSGAGQPKARKADPADSAVSPNYSADSSVASAGSGSSSFTPREPSTKPRNKATLSAGGTEPALAIFHTSRG